MEDARESPDILVGARNHLPDSIPNRCHRKVRNNFLHWSLKKYSSFDMFISSAPPLEWSASVTILPGLGTGEGTAMLKLCTR